MSGTIGSITPTRSICILHLGPWREILASTPALKWLSAQPSTGRLLVIASRSGTDLLRAGGASFVPALLEDGDWSSSSWLPWSAYRILQLARELRDQRFDITYDFH